MGTLSFNWILFAMVLAALSLFIMGLFMLFRRYGEVEWTNWRTKRARSQGLFAMLAAILFAVLGIAYFRPQAANYASIQERLSGYETRETNLSTELTELRMQRKQRDGSFSSIKDQLSNAVAKLAYVTHERDSVVQERDFFDNRLSGFETSRSKWSTREKDLNAEVAELALERDRLKSDNVETAGRIQELEARFLARRNARSKDYTAQLAALRAQNKQLSGENTDLAAQKQDVIDRNSLAMEAREKSFSERLDDLMSQRDRLSSRNVSLLAHQDQLKADNAELATQKQDLVGRYTLAMETRDKKHSTQHDMDVAERDRLNTTIADLTRARQDLVDRQGLAMEARENDRGQRIDDLMYQRDQFKSQAAAMTDQYISLEKHYAVEVKGRQQDHDVQLANLRAELDRTNSSNAELNQVLALQRSTQQTRDEKWTAAKAGFVDLKAKNGDQNLELLGLRAELAGLRKTQSDADKSNAMKVNTRATLPLINHFNASNTDLRLVSSGYNITAMPGEDMIAKQSGEYYRVALSNPATGRAYQFASGSYTKVLPRVNFEKSLDRVIAEIRKALDGRADYRFYVRGSASTGRYKGKPEKGYRYRSIKLKKSLGNNRYAEGLDEMRFGRVVRNADLPNLRAAYLSQLIAKRYQMAPPEILEGSVAKSRNTSEQSVSLILYVDRGGDRPGESMQRAQR